RPGAGDLVEPKPHVVRLDLVEPELVERLAHVEIALADRDHADLRIAPAREHDVIEVVRAKERQHGVALEVLEPRFLLEDAVADPDVQAARGHAEVALVRDNDLDPVDAAVAGAVDARALAVPDPEHAVVFAVPAQLRVLRAPQRGCGEFLVEAGLEDDVLFLQPLLGLPEILVEPADGGAAVSGDEAGGVQAGAAVALALHQQHADDRLRSGDEDAVFREVVLVVEGNVSKRLSGYLGIGHRPFPPAGLTPAVPAGSGLLLFI